VATKNPPRRCATAVAAVKASQAFTPSREGIYSQPPIQMQRNVKIGNLKTGLTRRLRRAISVQNLKEPVQNSEFRGKDAFMALAVLLIGVLIHGQFARLSAVGVSHLQQTGTSTAAPALDFEFFRARVQPIFLKKRKGLARCYVCHSQGTAFRLQPLSPGSPSWNETESRRNFEATLPFVVPGNPLASRLLTMPLAAEAGGVAFHPGGKHWSSQDDPEWQTLAAWLRVTPSRRK
jgi:hypothetical protein